ncbi:hypothetical protein IMG5_107890, partial [Ichthyophthirius multifiliis]
QIILNFNTLYLKFIIIYLLFLPIQKEDNFFYNNNFRYQYYTLLFHFNFKKQFQNLQTIYFQYIKFSDEIFIFLFILTIKNNIIFLETQFFYALFLKQIIFFIIFYLQSNYFINLFF